MKKLHISFILGALILILAACTPQAAPAVDEPAVVADTSDEAMMEEESEEAMMDEMSEDEAMMDEESHDDDMMAEESDEAMMEEKSEDEAMMDKESHDDDMMADESEEAMMEEKSEDEAMMDEESHDDDMMAEESDEAMMEEESEEGMMEEEGSMAELPAWQQIALTNAQTGESFTLGDFKGKTVFVEPMATWCTNCRRQFNAVQEAKNSLNSDEVVFIGLSVETSISDADLASYAEAQGFDFTWAVMTPEILQELAGTFGQSVSNPPATPHFIIRPDGSTTELDTGSESADELIAQIQEAMSNG